MKGILKDKKFLIICACVVGTFIIGISIYLFCTRDYGNIYYRTYTKEKGWSRWVKNGKTSGNNYPIKAFEIKIKTSNKKRVVYNCYYKNKWSRTIRFFKTCGNKKDNISGLKTMVSTIDEDNHEKIYLYGDKKYNIYYRTYNDKDKWLDWTNDNSISGNKKYPIKKIQIRLLLTDSVPEDYISDYRFKKYINRNF